MGREAFVEAEMLALIIADQTMPEMTGAELSARVLPIRPDLPIILCAGYRSIVSETKVASMGLKAFVEKPLRKKDIAKLIRKVLNGESSVS